MTTDKSKASEGDVTEDLDIVNDPRLFYDCLFSLYMEDGSAVESEFPSYEEFVDSLKDKTLPDKLGFVVPPKGMPSAAAFTTAASLGARVLRGVNGKVTADSILKSAGRMAAEEARRFAERTRTNLRDGGSAGTETGFSEPNGGDGGISKPGYSGGSSWNPSGLSTNNKVMATQFKTPVSFTGIPKYFLDGTQSNGPLLIKYGTPGLINPNGDEETWRLFELAIQSKWRREISKRVIINKKIDDAITPLNLNYYFNASIQACCVYYFWMSVIRYTDDSRNRNEAMLGLRDALSPDEYNALFILRRAIDNSVIPPFIHEFCHYMMGNYKQSFLPGSPLIKIMPFAFANTGDNNIAPEVQLIGSKRPVAYAADLLKAEYMRGIQDIMAKSFPDWCNADILDYETLPVIDPDYNSFWTNAHYVATHIVGAAPQITAVPFVADPGTTFIYNLHSDAPDGWTQAMQNIVNPGVPYSPGLFKNQLWLLNAPTESQPGTLGAMTTKYTSSGSTGQTSCVIWDQDSGTGFHPIELTQRWQTLASNTYNVFFNSSSIKGYQRFGTERIINMDELNIKQAVFEFMTLMYTRDLVSSPLPGKIQQGGKVYSNKKSGFSKKGKRGKSTRIDTDAKDEI